MVKFFCLCDVDQLTMQFEGIVYKSFCHSVLVFCSEDEGVEVVVPQCRVNFTFSGTNLKAHEALTSFALHTLDRVTKLKLSKDVSVLVYPHVYVYQCYVCVCVCVCACVCVRV